MLNPFYPVPSRKPLYGQLSWFLVWLGTTAFGVILKPSPTGHATHTQLGLAPCPSAVFLHRPCPGCGLTTSFTAMIHGNLPLAFSSHPLGPFLYLLFTVSALACLYGFVRKMRFNTDTPQFNRSLAYLVGGFLLFSLIRFAVVSDYSAYGRTSFQARTTASPK